MSDTPDLEFLALQEALVGRYSLERELGRGGMGVVYLAHEVRLDRPVALKLLPTQLATQPVFRERFLQEARTAAKLSHPNIVPIHAVDEVDDFVFFAMAFVEGESLGQRIRERGPVRPAEAARILREVAWALSYAHLQGIVHRDIKPDNILLEAAGGRALVTDFGIARAEESQGLTGVTEILGTAEFMSPEQASGEPVDARSDLYALGVVGHYMLSGKLPIQGSSVAATLAKQLTQEAPALATVAPGVPENLSQAIDRCLSKDPAERFPDGEELAGALSRALELRRDVPVALRVFAEQNQESSTAIAGTGLIAGFMVMAHIAWVVTGNRPPPLIEGVIALGTLVLAATPLFILTQRTRRLLRSGHGYDELVRALKSDIDLRREDLAFQEHGEPNWIDRWAIRTLVGGYSVSLVLALLLIFFPSIGEAVGQVGLSALFVLFGAGGVIGGAAGLTAAVRHQIRGVVPGVRWLKFWKSRVGKWLFRLAGINLDRISSTGAAYGPTEMALSIAADRLFDKLPKDVQKSFSELPDVVQTLEQDADRIRSRIKELDALIAQIDSEEALGRSARIAASPGVADKRGSLADDLRNARDAADARLSEVVAALETIRLELLRLHAGAGSVESMTADLTSARELSEDIEHLLEGGREVEKLLGSD
ncbi:protein kinase [Gemmatimonadota bacterium]